MKIRVIIKKAMTKMIMGLMATLISILYYLPTPHAGEEETNLTGLLGIAPQKKSVVKSGFIDFNYYYDNRDFHILTMNLGAQLPDDFEYFQLLNMYSPIGSGYSERPSDKWGVGFGIEYLVKF